MTSQELQQLQDEFTQWMKEPEQYRRLMCDRLNKMFAYILTLEQGKEHNKTCLQSNIEVMTRQNKRVRVLERQNAKLRAWIRANGCEIGCKTDRDIDCVSCQAWNLLDSLHS